MMLETLGEVDAARAIEAAIRKVTSTMKSQMANQMGMTTTQVGDRVAEAL